MATKRIRTLEDEDTKRRFLEFCDSVQATSAQEAQAKESFDRIVRGRKTARTKNAHRRGGTAA